VADLQYYNEISTITHVLKEELDERQYPHLAQWFNERMKQLKELQKTDSELAQIVAKYNL